MLDAHMTADAPRAQLIHIETDRRLGHEWDEWDGRPLPGNGDFSAPPGLFFRFAALTIGIGMAVGAALIFLLGPRLGTLWSMLPRTLWLALGAATAATWLWYGTLLLSFYGGVLALPEGWLERGPYLRLMSLTSYVARAFGERDWVEHAAIDVYNTLAERRQRKVGKGELLVLIPRCLSKQALDGVLAIAGRYEVPVFVATRGQLARRVIRERRPRAVVAVACERDMMTGLRDVAGRRPVHRLDGEPGLARHPRVGPEAGLHRGGQIRDLARVMAGAMGLRVVPRRLDVAVPHAGMRDLEALGRHQAVEGGGDPLRARVEDDDESTRVGPEVGAGGDGGAGGDKQTNAECGVRSAKWPDEHLRAGARRSTPHSAFHTPHAWHQCLC